MNNHSLSTANRNGGARILIVDDNEAGRYALAHCLRQAGHEVLQAGTGQEALRLVAEQRPELLLLDIKLPDVSGIEICHCLKTHPDTATIPIIQISALFTATHDRVHGLESGADAYLTAPFEPRELMAHVNSLLRVRQAETALRQARDELKLYSEKLEVTVRERTAKLRELVTELEHFSYTITHDMRAPLRAMRGFAELVNESCSESDSPEQKMFLRRIITSAERMDNLITDALNYSRAVRQEVPLAPIDLSALLRGMLDSYPEYLPSRANIQVIEPIPSVMGNEAALTQCFSNLLTNAVKFGKPDVKPDIRIWSEDVEQSSSAGSEAPANYVRVFVEDNGIGIQPTMLPRVFEMFSRGSNQFEGTGIGLALVRKVVQRMGGRVGVESQVGKGSRFWVDLQPAEAL